MDRWWIEHLGDDPTSLACESQANLLLRTILGLSVSTAWSFYWSFIQLICDF